MLKPRVLESHSSNGCPCTKHSHGKWCPLAHPQSGQWLLCHCRWCSHGIAPSTKSSNMWYFYHRDTPDEDCQRSKKTSEMHLVWFSGNIYVNLSNQQVLVVVLKGSWCVASWPPFPKFQKLQWVRWNIVEVLSTFLAGKKLETKLDSRAHKLQYTNIYIYMCVYVWKYIYIWSSILYDINKTRIYTKCIQLLIYYMMHNNMHIHVYTYIYIYILCTST